MMYGAGGIVGYSCGAIYACYSDVTLHMDAMSDAGDGSDVPIGGIAGAPAYCTAAYRCWFNADAAQTYYNDEAVAEPVAVGYSTLSYSVSDQEECAGLTSAELTSGVLETNLPTRSRRKSLPMRRRISPARPSACWATALR